MRRLIPTNLIELSSAPRAGLRFQAQRERELDDALFDLAAKLPASRDGVAVCREFSGPRGIPDLLATTTYHGALETREAAGVPAITNLSDAALLAALPRNAPRTLSWTTDACGLSQRQTLSRLRALSASGAIWKDGHGYTRNPAVQPIGHTYAFEAKVSDWGKGLTQALRYLAWADAAVIVLLDPPRDLSRVADQCRSLGVGLTSGDTWKVRPRLGRPNRGLRMAASEAWFRDFAGYSPSADA